jgi:HPt (histidine-containing phosphotransfer) domain-containing protein
VEFGERRTLDPGVIRELLGEPGGVEMAEKVAAIFERDRPARLAAIADGLADAHARAVAEAADAIRGSALSIGAERLAAVAAAVEETALGGDLERADALRPALARSYDEAARAVRAELDGAA